MSTEEWRDVPGYEGFYQVSNTGRVKSVHYRNGHVLSPAYNSDGYAYVNLTKNGKPKAFKIHRLVAAAFIGASPRGYEVNHKNLNKADNRASNLEYVSHKANMDHAIKHLGLFMARSGEANNSAKLTRAQVDEIRQLYSSGQYSIRQLAKQFNVGKSTIAYIINRHIWR